MRPRSARLPQHQQALAAVTWHHAADATIKASAMLQMRWIGASAEKDVQPTGPQGNAA